MSRPPALTETEKRNVIYDVLTLGRSQYSVAIDYGVHRSTISRILKAYKDSKKEGSNNNG